LLSGSRKAAAASAGRSSAPSASRIWPPKRSTRAARVGCPGSTTKRATSSASTTTAPCDRSRSATVDLPDPIPPVSPTSRIVTDATGAPIFALSVLKRATQSAEGDATDTPSGSRIGASTQRKHPHEPVRVAYVARGEVRQGREGCVDGG